MPAASNTLGQRLRWWRERRGLSQLDLAGVAGTSQRNLSFLESGRTAPSREMEIRIESFFPADDATTQVFKDWARAATQRSD